MRAPIFIVGCPRSGTTWVWGLITAHPDTVPLLPEDAVPGGGVETAIFTTEMALTDDEIFAIVGKKMDGDKRVMVEKTPLHLWFANRIWGLFPNAKVVCVTRNPYDTINSMLAAGDVLGMGAWNLKGAWVRWASSVEEIQKLEGDERFYTISYEGLSNDPVALLSKLLEWLELDPAHAQEMVDFNHRKSIYPQNPSGILRRGEVGAWKKEMHPQFVDFVTTMLLEKT